MQHRRTTLVSVAVTAMVIGCEEHREPAPAIVSSASAAAPDSPAPPPPSFSRPPPPSAPSPDIDPRLARVLDDASVTGAAYARRALYSWTSREQAATLRRRKTLLLDTELPSGPTPYVRLLEQTAAGEGAHADLARLLLLHPSLKLRRYAWVRPWPTRMGLAERDYGDQLLRVVLRPDAIIARFDPGAPEPFALQDLDERPVPLGRVLESPSRLAAVLHVRLDNDASVAYREYVLCNESMVAEWSLATSEVKSAIAADRELVSALAEAPPAPMAARPLWLLRDEGASVRGEAAPAPTLGTPAAQGYARALAFDNDRYRSTPANLAALADALEKAAQIGPPLVVKPSVRFDVDASIPHVRIRKPPLRVLPVV